MQIPKIQTTGLNREIDIHVDEIETNTRIDQSFKDFTPWDDNSPIPEIREIQAEPKL